MFLIFLYMFLKRGKLKIIEYAVIIMLTAINIIFVDGQISAICAILAAAGCVFTSVVSYKKFTIPAGLLKLWNIFAVSSYMICAVVQFIWALLYRDDPDIWYNRYYSLENRIYTNHLLLKCFPFSWFGTDFPQTGSGWTEESPDFYFWVDCSYTRIYAMYGIVAFVVFMGLLTWITIRLLKRKNYFGMFLMMVIAFDLMIEHHMIEISYNTFLVLAFANLDKLFATKHDILSLSHDHPG